MVINCVTNKKWAPFSFLTGSVYLKTIKNGLSSVLRKDLGLGISIKYLHSVPILVLIFYNNCFPQSSSW